MSHPPINRFPVPDIAGLPDDIRNAIMAVQEKAGFVPNVFLTLAHRPEEFRAFFAYHDALMERDSGLSKAEREMIVVATSNGNNCQYCVVAHGAILRIRAKNSLMADQVAINYRKADITERQKAMLDFAMTVSNDSGRLGQADFDVAFDVASMHARHLDLDQYLVAVALEDQLVDIVAERTRHVDAVARPADDCNRAGRVVDIDVTVGRRIHALVDVLAECRQRQKRPENGHCYPVHVLDHHYHPRADPVLRPKYPCVS